MRADLRLRSQWFSPFPADRKAMCPGCAPARHVAAPASVEVELELLAAVPVPRSMPLSWELTVRWLVSFGGVDQHQPEQRRNSARVWCGSRSDGLVLVACFLSGHHGNAPA